MRDLEKALADISEIRSQMARGTEFRGYGPATLAATGGLALLAAAGQALWLRQPAAHVGLYIALWGTTAAISVILIGLDMILRSRRIHSGLAQEMIWSAVEQFLPAGVAGGLVTAVLLQYAPESLWMLPGIWQIVFSLGVFACCRFLPRAMFAVGLWYLIAGLACLVFAQAEHAFSPWAMGAPYGVGQLLVAAVLQRYAAGESDGQL
ncbi:MAG TPA: hypothetical protein VN823_17180 [Stellaceae bacterium]|nr:hypothetical protein [Stellaceae bacterium]